MKNKHFMAALMAGSLTLATSLRGGGPPEPAPASPPPGQPGQMQPGSGTQEVRGTEMAPEHSCLCATHILGHEVRNDVGERLGTLQDLILSLDSDAARFAIVKCGGTLGLGGTRVAVPLKDLKWSDDTKRFIMAASKEQIRSANPIPTGGWAFVANEKWTARIDRYYGDPGTADLSQSSRPGSTELDESREFVRDPALPEPGIGLEDQVPNAEIGAKMPPLPMSADVGLLAKVTELIQQYAGPAKGGDIDATVENGVVTLKGKVATVMQKRQLEDRIKELDGIVALMDDRLVATND